ncbi:hypothetical protein BGZ61DRAFT_527082 [Ilyonectria robusta]|uniref:uncharacterized protein n=1 Tax=Ilyonectria robusta TaxID=1079257 RepID=UPI001E8D73BB|nr:uncharacterized protein BGZ61DRAFT_527082 [Ilyonectria robusta]KAH8736091.1 hypothetical protein BGZ61DRAFT_527082 [Ilyonectria robusta]
MSQPTRDPSMIESARRQACPPSSTSPEHGKEVTGYIEIITNNGTFGDMFWSKSAPPKKKIDSLHVNGDGSTTGTEPLDPMAGKPTEGKAQSGRPSTNN